MTLGKLFYLCTVSDLKAERRMDLTQNTYVDKTSVAKSIWNLPIRCSSGLWQPLELIRMQMTLWPQPSPPGSESAPGGSQFLKHWLNPQPHWLPGPLGRKPQGKEVD